MILPAASRRNLIDLAKNKGVYLEGNILKLLDPGEDHEFCTYLKEASDRDKEFRRKRLDVTKQVQIQNRELQEAQIKLREALTEAENAKCEAIADLDLLQKKTQFELMSRIVMVALSLVVGIGVSSTILYVAALATNKDTTVIGNAWSSTLGILLTNSFSILGTIMGVRYASDAAKPQEKK
jgi:lipid II:glycine glycyltransferase (peptidoglycan interpeptide bridge formation enzyme)